MDQELNCIVRIATSDDHKYTDVIIKEMTMSAAKRGVHINPRTPEYIMEKMDAGLSVIAINPENGEWVGFCCIEVWQHEKYVANSGLIISPQYRGMGISREIKLKLFEQCRIKFPTAKLFSLSTSPAVRHINTELGYKILPHADIMKDELFLNGGNTWVNYIELMSDEKLSPLYVAMVFDPAEESAEAVVPGIGEYLLDRIKSINTKKTEGVLESLSTDYVANAV